MECSGAARAAVATLLAAVALFPAGYLTFAAIPVLHDGGWLAHFAATTLPSQAATTIVVVVEAALVAAAAGAVPAVLVARFDFPLRRLAIALALLPLLFAPYAAGGLWVGYGSAPFLQSREALAIVLGFACAPYVFVIFLVAATRLPDSFGELASVLGLGFRDRLLKLYAPLYAVPAAAAFLVVVALTAGDYGTADRLGIGTVSVGLHNLWLATQSSQVGAVVACVLVVPALLLMVAAVQASTRIISRNPSVAASAACRRRPLGRPAAAAILAWSLACSLAAFWIPEALAVRWAWLNFARTRFAAIPGDFLNAALTAGMTAALVAATCLLVAATMRLGAASRLAERTPWLFLANSFMPSLVLALVFVMATADGSVGANLLGSLRDTRLPIVAADALRFMPFAMLPLIDALARTPPALVEVSRSVGHGPLAARAHAFAGHVLPALVLGSALVFLEALKELDLSLMLQPFGYTSPALKIYAFARNQNMDRASIWILLTQLLMLPPVWLLWRRLDRLGTAGARA